MNIPKVAQQNWWTEKDVDGCWHIGTGNRSFADLGDGENAETTAKAICNAHQESLERILADANDDELDTSCSHSYPQMGCPDCGAWLPQTLADAVAPLVTGLQEIYKVIEPCRELPATGKMAEVLAKVDDICEKALAGATTEGNVSTPPK